MHDMTPTSSTTTPAEEASCADAQPAYRIEGPLTVYTVEAQRTQLLEQLAAPGLVLNLEAVDACDCAGLQLLCATVKSARERGLRLEVTSLSPAVATAAQGLGLDLAEFSV